MTEPPRLPGVITFVVRFWREWSAAGQRWRGRIQHVESGNAASFTDVNMMMRFLRSSGALGEDESVPDEQEE